MTQILLIALGAAIGANARYWLTQWVTMRWGAGFPYGTMLINVLGSFAIGVVMMLAATNTAITVNWRLLLVTGLLGGFTTFSSFSYETYQLLVGGNILLAAINMFGSVGLGLLGVTLGATLVRLLA